MSDKLPPVNCSRKFKLHKFPQQTGILFRPAIHLLSYLYPNFKEFVRNIQNRNRTSCKKNVSLIQRPPIFEWLQMKLSEGNSATFPQATPFLYCLHSLTRHGRHGAKTRPDRQRHAERPPSGERGSIGWVAEADESCCWKWNMISPRGIRSEEHVAAAASATKPFHHLYHHHQDSFVCWMDVLSPPPPPPACLAATTCHEKLSRKLRPIRGRWLGLRSSRLQIVIKFDYQAPQGG